MLQRPGQHPKRAYEPEPDEARQRLQAPVQNAELEAGPEQGVARRAIALDQEVEIGGLAEREPARPEPVDLDALGAAPARLFDPAAATATLAGTVQAVFGPGAGSRIRAALQRRW